MVKQSKLVYVIGSIVIGIITIIAVVAGLMLSGVIDASSHKLVFISKSEEIVYTGKTLVCTDYEIESGELKNGHTAQVVMTGSQTEVGESQNTYVVSIFDENGADVTADYEITTHYGTLRVLAKPLFVKSGDAVEEYNGSAVKNGETSITAGELMEGHTIEYIVTGARTDAGKGDNTFVVVIRDEKGNDVTKNYSVNYSYGVLEVLPMKVAINCSDKTVSYDGGVHEFPSDQWEYDSNKRPADGLDVQVFFSGRTSSVGSVEVKLSSFIVMDGDRDVSFNYEFSFAGAELKVEPCKITISSGNAKKEYDGTPLVNQEKPTVVDGALIEGHYISDWEITGTQTEIGDSPNTMNPDSIVIKDADGNDVTDQYEITVKEGNLVVVSSGGNELEDNPGVDEEDPSDYDEQLMETVVGKVTATHSDVMYLRRGSFCDYAGSGSSWSVASEYSVLLDDTFGMNYLVGAGLKNRGIVTLKTVKIQPINKVFGYCLPYYLANDSSSISEIQTSDTVNSGELSSVYFPNYYHVDHILDNDVENSILKSGFLGDYSDEETAYYRYVKNQYLNKTSNNAYAKAVEIINDNGWKKDDSDIISKVCTYVKGLADYNVNTDIEEKETDVIYAMLCNADKGESEKYTALCRHYAGAGVALFRALEIPARYTVGYMVETVADEEVEVKVKNGHAWVEVYLQGIGWIPVECTASSNSNGGSGGSGSGTIKLTIKPIETRQKYTGELIEPKDVVTVKGEGWETLTDQGYYLDSELVNVIGANSAVGKHDTTIEPNSIVIRNENGEDVTDSEFIIDLSNGQLHIYQYELTVTTNTAEKVYDATPLTYLTSDTDCGYKLTGDVFADYVYNVQLTGSRQTVGSSANTVKISITDKDGNDNVTDSYLIHYNYGTLKVTRRPITIVAGSVTEEYEFGKVLTIDPNNYEIMGTLASSSHFVEAKIIGTLESFGVTYTQVEFVRIYDKTEDGTEDVTDQYEISHKYGELKMYLPE